MATQIPSKLKQLTNIELALIQRIDKLNFVITGNAELVQTLNNHNHLCVVLIIEPIRRLAEWIITIVCTIQ